MPTWTFFLERFEFNSHQKDKEKKMKKKKKISMMMLVMVSGDRLMMKVVKDWKPYDFDTMLSYERLPIYWNCEENTKIQLHDLMINPLFI